MASVEQAPRILRRRLEEERERDQRDRRSSDPGGEVVPSHDLAALDVRMRQLTPEGEVRRVEDAHGHPQADDRGREPDKGQAVAQTVGRVEDRQEKERDRNGRGEHVRMPASPSRAGSIRQGPNYRIGETIEHKGNRDRQTGQPSRQTDHLIVVQECIGTQREERDRFGGAADPEGELGAQPERRRLRGRRSVGRAHCAGHALLQTPLFECAVCRSKRVCAPARQSPG